MNLNQVTLPARNLAPAVAFYQLWREARLRDPAGNALCLFFAGPNRRDPPGG